MVDLGKTTVCAGHDKVVHDVGTALCQRRANARLADLARRPSNHVVGDRAEDQCEQQRAGDGEQEQRGTDARDAGRRTGVSGHGRHGDQGRTRDEAADRFKHKPRVVLVRKDSA